MIKEFINIVESMGVRLKRVNARTIINTTKTAE